MPAGASYSSNVCGARSARPSRRPGGPTRSATDAPSPVRRKHLLHAWIEGVGTGGDRDAREVELVLDLRRDAGEHEPHALLLQRRRTFEQRLATGVVDVGHRDSVDAEPLDRGAVPARETTDLLAEVRRVREIQTGLPTEDDEPRLDLRCDHALQRPPVVLAVPAQHRGRRAVTAA